MNIPDRRQRYRNGYKKSRPELSVHDDLAEKEGFEPSLRFSRTTPLAGEPLRPLGYFSEYNFFQFFRVPPPLLKKLAEKVGFEPTVPCGITGFQDQLLKPLGHLSLRNFMYIDYIKGCFECQPSCFALFSNICGYKKERRPQPPFFLIRSFLLSPLPRPFPLPGRRPRPAGAWRCSPPARPRLAA